MKVIIPVAGIGKRLRPHTHSQPKPLLHVAGKPIIAHVLAPVVQVNPEEVIFVVGYRGEQIREYVRANYSFKSTFVRQDQLLGLGYAVNQAMASMDDSELLIVLGDTIVDCNLAAFIATSDYTLGLRKVDDPTRFGIAEIENGRIARLQEKPSRPRSDLAVIGLYYFRDSKLLRSVLSAHVESGARTRGEIQFTDALEQMIQKGVEFHPYEVRDWYDCGKKETVLETNRHILGKISHTPKIDGSVMIPPVFVEESARVEDSIIGPNVSISCGATIKNCIIRDSIVSSDATLENFVMDGSLIGNEAVIKGVARTLNIGDSSEIG